MKGHFNGILSMDGYPVTDHLRLSVAFPSEASLPEIRPWRLFSWTSGSRAAMQNGPLLRLTLVMLGQAAWEQFQ